jgi:hypothetical protein
LVGPHGFDLPPEEFSANQTVFLEVVVSATAAGHMLDPFIEIEHGQGRFRQGFERGANGNRFLNLSLAFQNTPTSASRRIALHGRHIRWKAEGTLIAFSAPATRCGETMVVSPHPDDSEIAAFGWYSQNPSWVVTVTAGERSPTDLSNVVPAREEKAHWLALLRTWDSLQIPALGGVPRDRRVSLVYPDGGLKMMHDSPTRSYQLACEDTLPRQVLRSRNPLAQFQGATPDCTWGGLVAEFQWLLNTTRPSTVMCPHPLVDPSPDHVFTTLAIAEALRNGTHQPDIFLLYIVHVNEVPIYPFGTAECAVSLPPWWKDEWLADTIYSHALTEETRQAKFFAVEASHDLRAYADLRLRSIGRLMVSIRRELAAFVSGMGLRPTDFLRRAPRPNELYYVVSARGFVDLAERALKVQANTNPR